MAVGPQHMYSVNGMCVFCPCLAFDEKVTQATCHLTAHTATQITSLASSKEYYSLPIDGLETLATISDDSIGWPLMIRIPLPNFWCYQP